MSMSFRRAPSPTQPPLLSILLKTWRQTRKLSQLELALDAGVSQRHLSFVESGRAQPSRDLIVLLAETLEVPLRERNVLLRAGGFAPLFEQRHLNDDDMAGVRQALEMALRHHEPYPAVVVDRQWNMVLCNAAADRFIGLLGEPEAVWQRVDPSGGKNVLRMTFSEQGMRPLLKNWVQLAPLLLIRLQRESSADPTHQALRALYQELSQLPSVTALSSCGHLQGWASALPPTLNMALGLGEATLNVFSMMSTFGTALDITAEELRTETFFPADAFTADFFRQLAMPDPPAGGSHVRHQGSMRG